MKLEKSAPYLYTSLLLLGTLITSNAVAQTVEPEIDLSTPNQSLPNLTELDSVPRTLKEVDWLSQTDNSPNPSPTPDINPDTAQTPETEQVPSLQVRPRIGAEFTTGPGVGYESSFGAIETFVPLRQTLGSNLTFLEGRLLLSTEDALASGNLIVGHRFYSREANRIFGGYIGYDHRETSDSSFNQLGVGLESLGEIWDFRLNGYLPVGDTRQVVASSTFDSGFQPTGTLVFQGNSLVLPGERIFQSTTIQEAAMSGLDFEVGAKIAEFANGGEVRGYGGVYYYDASGSPSTVGGKLRVEVRPTDYLNLGLGVQHDDLFGTNILFTVGGTFPGTRPFGYRKQPDEPESVWARMGESISRAALIVVDQQVESESFTQQSNVVASNPDTGQPWVFVQVKEGGNGNGTFENPFGTVLEGVGVAQSDGNYIVYVRSGAASDTGPITIPAKVQLLSAGVLQQINTQEFGLVTLPFSGSGQLTNFTGTITMEEQSVLSGFNLTSNNGPGIVARNLNFVTIRDSNIISSSEAALLLENTTGNVTLTNTNLTGDGVPVLVGTKINSATFTSGSLTSTNSVTNGITFDGITGVVDISTAPITITAPQVNGIAASNVTGSLNLANGQITSSQAEAVLLENSTGAINVSGFEITNSGSSGIAGVNLAAESVALTNNTITNAASEGILFNNVTGQVALTNNEIDNSVAEGFFLNNDQGEVELIFDSNTITNNGGGSNEGDGAKIELRNTAQGTFNLSNNTIADNSGLFGLADGVDIQLFESAQGTFNLDNNQITGNQLDGVNLELEATAQGNFNITDNQIIGNQSSGIDVSLSDDAQQTFNISGNTITGNQSHGIDVSFSNNTQGTFNISGNTIADNQDNGINIQVSDTAQGTLNITDNQEIARNGSYGIFTTTSDTTQLQLLIESNQITNNPFAGLSLNSFDSATILAKVNLNTLTEGTFVDFEALTINPDATICLQPSNNQIGTLFWNDFFAGQIEVEADTLPTNNISTSNLIFWSGTTVPAGTCGFP
ncbi:MAG: hypothetical protein F6K31_04475 [Symploca sp. SIO2G7]|nr:hypothetical protein [Symploca sp. SIO2G7]